MKRAVVLVGNPAAPYSRGLRIARTLVQAGYRVEIAAVASAGLPDRETGDGWELRRYRPTGRWARLAGTTGRPGSARGGDRPRSAGPARRIAGRVAGLAGALRRWIFWPHTVRGWWATLDRELEPADLYHACGSLTIEPALRARRRSPTGPAGRRAVVIYDAIDDVFESNNVLDMPAPLRSWHARRETRWARAADAVITVNDALAERLARRWRLSSTPAVVANYPDPPPAADPSAPADDPGRPNHLRNELGLPATTRIVLFQGRLGPRLGLDAAAEAVLNVPSAVLVLLGFGRWFEREKDRDLDARFAGRHFTLPARHPDELLAWTADADVALVPLPPVSVNQRLSSPNKFWEALAAGTPVVVPAGLSYMAGIVQASDLGIVAQSEGSADLGAGIMACLERLDADPAWRTRIRAAAARDYTWPVAAAVYRAVLARLA